MCFTKLYKKWRALIHRKEYLFSAFYVFSRKLSVLDVIQVDSQEKKKVGVLWHNTWEIDQAKTNIWNLQRVTVMGGNEFDDKLLEPCDDLLLAEFGSLQTKLRKHLINFNPQQ